MLPIPYREKIYHPAISQPVLTEGTFDLGRNDTLIRNQTEPRIETTEIGKRFITVQRDDYKNTTLIPARLMPLLNVVRQIVKGEGSLSDAFVSHLDHTDAGWAVSLTPKGETDEITVVGCGEILTAIHVATENGERRETQFLRPR